jgi:hypothetical protein
MLLVSTLGAANGTLGSSYLLWVPVYILAQFGLGLCSSVTLQNYIVEIAVFDTTGLIRFKDHVLFHRNSDESAKQICHVFWNACGYKLATLSSLDH